MGMSIDLALLNEVSNFTQSYDDIFISIVKQTCLQLQITEDIEMSCVFVDNPKIQELNRTYRHLDKPTDVISFALEDNGVMEVKGAPRCIGDIFISIDRAKQQAREYGHSLDREICFLFTHGLLHLLGFDHMQKEEEEAMNALQESILSALHINR